MERRVYWSPDQASHVWHLYWDCPELESASEKQGGSTEAAINRGKTHVCPVCRARYDKGFPVPYAPPQKERPAPTPTPQPVQPPSQSKPAPAPAPKPAKPEKKKQPWGKMIASAVVAGLLVWLCLEVFYSDLIVRNHDIWYDRGASDGYEDGYSDGLDKGYENGQADGHRDGVSEGYQRGLVAGQNSVNDNYDSGYNDGYSDGYADGQNSVSTYSTYTEPSYSDTTVYITATGEKYHRWGCQYLSQSCYSISLSDAQSRGYTPCSRCDPPT